MNVQASTDTEPRRGREQELRQGRSWTLEGQQDDRCNAGFLSSYTPTASPSILHSHAQASTDTEPRRDRGQESRQARPRTPVGQQDDKFDFGKFVKGDLPGKLAALLVHPLHPLA